MIGGWECNLARSSALRLISFVFLGDLGALVVNRTAEEFHGSDSSVSRDAQELKHLPPTDR